MNVQEAALRKLSTRNRSIFELKKILLDKGYDLQEVEETIVDFVNCGYLNDKRFCLEYFRYAFRKGKSRQRVAVELKIKGVSQDLIDEMYLEYLTQEEAIDEKEKALSECEKVLRKADLSIDDEIPEKVFARVARRLSSLGYTSDIIYGILNNLKRLK